MNLTIHSTSCADSDRALALDLDRVENSLITAQTRYGHRARRDVLAYSFQVFVVIPGGCCYVPGAGGGQGSGACVVLSERFDG